MPDRRIALAAASTVALVSSFAFAIDRSWTNPAGGQIQASTNWNPTGAPQPEDRLIFNLGSASAYPLTTSGGSTTYAQMLIGNDMVNQRFFGLTLTSPTNSLIVGDATGQAGRMDMGGTGQSSVNFVDAIIANLAGSTGVVTLQSFGTLNTGLIGTGHLIIGNFGAGIIDTNNRCFVNVATLSLGAQPGGSGTVHFKGGFNSGSISGDLYVGGSAAGPGGLGTFMVTGGPTIANARVGGTAVVYEGGRIVLSGAESGSFNAVRQEGGFISGTGGTPTMRVQNLYRMNGGSANISGLNAGSLRVARGSMTLPGINEISNDIVVAIDTSLPGPMTTPEFINGNTGVGSTFHIGGDDNGPIGPGIVRSAPGGGIREFRGNAGASMIIHPEGVFAAAGTLRFPAGVTNHGLFAPGDTNAVESITLQGSGSPITFADDGELNITIQVNSPTSIASDSFFSFDPDYLLDGLLTVEFAGPLRTSVGDSVSILRGSLAQPTPFQVIGQFDNPNNRVLAGGRTFEIVYSPTEVRLIDISGPSATRWNVDASGNWSDPANWESGVPNGPGLTANLTGAITAPRTITVDTPIVVGAINFDNVNRYTVAGISTLTLNGSGATASINVASGNHSISAPVSIGTDLAINVAPFASTLTIDADVVSDPAGNTVTKSGPGTMEVKRLRVEGLAIAAGSVKTRPSGGTSNVKSLSIAGTTNAWTSKLDLSDNSLVVDYAQDSPFSTIQNQIKNGFNQGNWQGNGILSSAAGDASFPGGTALGYSEATEIFGSFPAMFLGETVDSSSVLVRYTLCGDSNLDGTVDLTDFARLTVSFGLTARTWSQADFTYDGLVNIDDFALLSANFNQSLPAPVPAAAVPDPSCGAGLSAVLVLSRRRTRNRLAQCC